MPLPRPLSPFAPVIPQKVRAASALMALLLAPVAARCAAPVAMKAEPFDLTQVRLLDGPFRDAMLRDKAYLLSLDPERLLRNFRVTAGLPAGNGEPLGGWEKPNCELRGHFVGHYLSACALMYASTGDEALKQRADSLVAELAKCQEAMPSQGYNPGFLSAYPESFFDRVDEAKKVWAPYYTLHKIMAGLLDVHQRDGNPQALDVLTKMAAWLKARVDRLPHEQMQKALTIEHGGMNEALANLYAVTGNPDHLHLAQAFNHEAVFDPLARGEDKLDGLHANTQIPKIIGAAREYELTGDPRLHDIASFFWDRVALHRSWVIGGHSDNEHFFPVNQSAAHLSPVTAETCNTYNMLKLTRHLFAWEPSARMMDFYERGLYNHILASQDPDSGMMLYFCALKPGVFKVYNTPDQSFWCCTGTGTENHAKYGDTIYFHGGQDALYVNLFIPSELAWKEKGLTLRQETRFPALDSTTLSFACAQPVKLAVKVRRPAWATAGAEVTINGEKQAVESAPCSYFTLEREWRDGDKMEIRLPMRAHAETLADDPNTMALLYGPLVLAARLGTEGLPSGGQQAKDQKDFAKMPVPMAPPILVADSAEQAAASLLQHGWSLEFQSQTITKPANISFTPFYLLHHERYAVYLKRQSGEDWANEKPEAPTAPVGFVFAASLRFAALVLQL